MQGELKTQLTDHNNTLAVLTSQLDAAKVENARLLTSADQTRLDHQRQLVELQHGLNRKVKADENVYKVIVVAQDYYSIPVYRDYMT